MKKTSCKRGFTLIELLVVALIIGILAAVAVPQYQSAVAKAKYAKMRAFADSIVIASQAAYLRNGEVPHTFDELDITVPGDMTIVPTTGSAKTISDYCALGSEFYCCLQFPVPSGSSGGVMCGRNDLNIGYGSAYIDDNGIPVNRKRCLQKTGEETLCQKLPGATKVDGLAMLTPTALSVGYTHFEIMD